MFEDPFKIFKNLRKDLGEDPDKDLQGSLRILSRSSIKNLRKDL